MYESILPIYETMFIVSTLLIAITLIQNTPKAVIWDHFLIN